MEWRSEEIGGRMSEDTIHKQIRNMIHTRHTYNGQFTFLSEYILNIQPELTLMGNIDYIGPPKI